MANRTREYFNFSKKERTGIIVLLFIISCVWIFPSLFPGKNNVVNEKEAVVFRQEVAAYKARLRDNDEHADTHGTDTVQSFITPGKASPSPSLFYFDPNTLSPAGWQQLGISDRTIQTIENYISKGGQFYKPEDMGKIFGLKKEDYNRLLPYARIGKPGKYNEKTMPISVYKPVTDNAKEPVDINSADTTAFIKLPGIGSKLAGRIVHFRDKLGGFYSVEQIAEVYGIHDTVYQKIRNHLTCSGSNVHKLNINTASLDILKAHPYIKYQLGNAVIQYRMQHGNIDSIDQLKEIHLVTEGVFQKIAPYLTTH
ncbi:MAG: helix-hairpin-helix domain-containing protein [Chitinophagaceae bacterium]|nr:helix-hairpin-helix domain-containing protein [Chitinophagaceae bacterium]